jgi:nucleoside-diphosphate-sugar epimerase
LELADKRILVTGAKGFIASHLVARLAADERARVRASARNGARPPEILRSDPRIEYVQADVTDREDVLRAASGCDIIIHTAACQPLRPQPAREEFYAVNVGGTQSLMRAFAPAGEGRFVLLSTINVHGIPPPTNARADSPIVNSGDLYSDSKAEGERAAWNLSQEFSIPLTVIRPGCTFGPRGYAWTIQPVERIRQGIPVLIGQGRGICNPMYVDNLVDLIVVAIKRDEAINQSFVGCQGRGVEWRDFLGAYGQMLKMKPRSVPYWAAAVGGRISHLYERASGRQGFLSSTNVAFYTHCVTFDVKKNARLLGYQPRLSFEDGMRRTEAWLRDRKLV